jgi:hypothetical protein
MPNKSKIYSVLVAYNSTKEDLGDSLNTLLRQTDFLVVCNNSKDDLIFNHHSQCHLNMLGSVWTLARTPCKRGSWKLNLNVL